MSGSRLKQQFQALFHHYQGHDSDVTVSELVDVLQCTRRNVRMVMGKLSDENWIDWSPAVGRGKLSQLRFLVTDEALIQADVVASIQEGKFEKALTLLENDRQKFAAAISSQLGYASYAGRQVLRLPYYRPLNTLMPLIPMRRSEHHLARQVYNGLTRFCEKSSSIQPDLSHHWRMLSPMQWRFFLRPGVRFHDGTRVMAEDYIQSLRRLSSRPLFQHIDHIESSYANVLDVHLSMPDVHFIEALASIEAVILPAKNLDDDDFIPIGTGPYRVAYSDSQRLKLEAFDSYFGFRALIDEIEIWVLESINACQLKPETLESITPPYGVATSTRYSRLDEGCSYLVINQRSGVCIDPRWQEYLVNRINPLELHRRIERTDANFFQMIPAYGFLPGWTHQAARAQYAQPPENISELCLAYVESHPIFKAMARLIQSLLSEDGVSCRLRPMSYVDFHLSQGEEVDLWLGGINLVSRYPSMIIDWLFQNNHIRRAVPDGVYNEASLALNSWRSGEDALCPAESIINNLISGRVLLPLFHTWAGVDAGHSVKGVETNSMGWFDFSSAWVDTTH
ncbi:SgrR family transcriptional regulator [Thaumasiovibrio sp. DFM-14]|uniref:SgrR family transcriptional regulator n=1 Tax=Thaumasiovibrio sp. DFM-14 TaxID=3384792 RepID=UPI00399FF67B